MRPALEELLVSGRLKRHRASRSEIQALLAVVERDLADMGVAGLSEDRRFTIAYSAALQAGRALLASEGYRTAGQGHHASVFQALRHLLPKEDAPILDYFDDCRSKRNLAEYTGTEIASAQEVEELADEARRFALLVRETIRRRHPRLR